METKICTKCGEEKPLSEFYKTVKRGKAHIKAECKKCNNLRSKKQYWDDPELARKRGRDYGKKVTSEKGDTWEKRKILSNKHREKNKEKIKKQLRKHYLDNKDKICERARLHRLENKDKIKERVKKSRERNNDEHLKKERKRNNKYTLELSDCYIRNLLREKSGITTDQINNHPELVEQRRAIIQLKRAINKSKKSAPAKEKEIYTCPHCEKNNTAKNGFSTNKKKQTIYCEDCKKFINVPIKLKQNEISRQP